MSPFCLSHLGDILLFRRVLSSPRYFHDGSWGALPFSIFCRSCLCGRGFPWDCLFSSFVRLFWSSGKYRESKNPTTPTEDGRIPPYVCFFFVVLSIGILLWCSPGGGVVGAYLKATSVRLFAWGSLRVSHFERSTVTLTKFDEESLKDVWIEVLKHKFKCVFLRTIFFGPVTTVARKPLGRLQ